MGFRSTRNKAMVRLHSTDGKVRYEMETLPGVNPTLEQIEKNLRDALDMCQRFREVEPATVTGEET